MSSSILKPELLLRALPIFMRCLSLVSLKEPLAIETVQESELIRLFSVLEEMLCVFE